MDRFNTLLLDHAMRDGMHVVEIHERIAEPEDFMDLCHMNRLGIRRMAEAFAGPVGKMLAEH